MPATGATYKVEINHDILGERIRWLPSIPPGPADLDGRVTHHGLVVCGGQDGEERNLLSVIDMVVTSRGNAVLGLDDKSVAFFAHASKMTDLHVCEQAGSLVNVLVGTIDGSLHLLRLMVPRTPGAGFEDVQRLMPQPELENVPVWLRPHKGAVAAVDMQEETKNVLTAGADGSLFVLDIENVNATLSAATNEMDADDAAMDAMDVGEQRRRGGRLPEIVPYKRGKGFVSYTCARWVDRNLFVTSQNVGGLEMWDVRCPPTPVSRSSVECGATGLGPADRGCHRVIYSLQVHPSRPDLCASGGSGGSVALWDLRVGGRPVALTQPDIAAGPVWEVHFDTREYVQYGAEASSGKQAPLPPVLFCTEDGGLFRVSGAEAPSASAPAASGRAEELTWQGSLRRGPQALTQIPVAIHSFDVGGPFGSDVVAATARQTVMYMQTA